MCKGSFENVRDVVIGERPKLSWSLDADSFGASRIQVDEKPSRSN